MKKLGIVTLDSLWNYGNRLQNYALQKFLENYADQVDTLWHSPIDKFSIDMKKWPIQRRVRYAFMGNRVEKRINQCIRSSIRTYQFQQFTQQYICTKYEYGNLKRSNAGGGV